MAKKSRRRKQHGKQPQSSYINQLHIQQLISQIHTKMSHRDFAGVITSCQHLLKHYLQQPTPQRIEVLGYMGVASTMMERYQDSYDAFTEALAIEPLNPELWYNRGIASYFTGRTGQYSRDLERAVELLKTSTKMAPFREELLPKYRQELEKSQKQLEYALEVHGPDFTLNQLIEQDEEFLHGLSLTQAENWQEAEQAFRRVIAMGECQPQHSGNLGVTLLMQKRYDEAEAALKRALEFDPDYSLARRNLAALPALRRGKTADVTIENEPESDIEHSVTIFQRGNDKLPTTTTNITKERTLTQAHLGKQEPRYRFFLNPYEAMRFTRCPQCGNKTRQRKLPLVIHVDPMNLLSINKTCRYCPDCDLLIAHRDQLEGLLVAIFEESNPDVIGNNYLVVGTIDRVNWKEGAQQAKTGRDLLDVLHDFKEVTSFKPVIG